MPVATLFNDILDLFWSAFCIPFLNDAMFQRGFVWAFILAGVIGGTSRFIIFQWRKVRDFFKPTQRPATTPGPSGYQRMHGCIMGVFAIFAFFVAVVLILALGEVF